MSTSTEKFFKGVFTALVTPFYNNKIDYESLEKLVEYQISSGIQGLVLLGTTGESATLDEEERDELLKKVIKQINGRVPVLIGSGM